MLIILFLNVSWPCVWPKIYTRAFSSLIDARDTKLPGAGSRLARNSTAPLSSLASRLPAMGACHGRRPWALAMGAHGLWSCELMMIVARHCNLVYVVANPLNSTTTNYRAIFLFFYLYAAAVNWMRALCKVGIGNLRPRMSCMLRTRSAAGKIFF